MSAKFEYTSLLLEGKIGDAEDGGLIKGEEAEDFNYKLMAAKRIHAVGDKRGAWFLLREIGKDLPNAKLIEVGEK